MKAYGLQKMTLLDFPGKVACTVFTGGCNLRCPFCHNAGLVTDIDDTAVYTEEEILKFLSGRKGLLDGVAITGGEPLLQPDIIDFIKKVRNLGFAVKLDTNGTFPDKLREIIDGGLVDYVAMDIKNSPEKYADTVGIKNFDVSNIKKSISILLENKVPYEFRTTVVKQFHTTESIKGAAGMIKGASKYFLQNFVDSGNLIGENLEGVTKTKMEKMREVSTTFVQDTQLRGV